MMVSLAMYCAAPDAVSYCEKLCSDVGVRCVSRNVHPGRQGLTDFYFQWNRWASSGVFITRTDADRYSRRANRRVHAGASSCPSRSETGVVRLTPPLTDSLLRSSCSYFLHRTKTEPNQWYLPLPSLWGEVGRDLTLRSVGWTQRLLRPSHHRLCRVISGVGSSTYLHGTLLIFPGVSSAISMHHCVIVFLLSMLPYIGTLAAFNSLTACMSIVSLTILLLTSAFPIDRGLGKLEIRFLQAGEVLRTPSAPPDSTSTHLSQA